jgi:hypothetical protein
VAMPLTDGDQKASSAKQLIPKDKTVSRAGGCKSCREVVAIARRDLPPASRGKHKEIIIGRKSHGSSIFSALRSCLNI